MCLLHFSWFNFRRHIFIELARIIAAMMLNSHKDRIFLSQQVGYTFIMYIIIICKRLEGSSALLAFFTTISYCNIFDLKPNRPMNLNYGTASHSLHEQKVQLTTA